MPSRKFADPRWVRVDQLLHQIELDCIDGIALTPGLADPDHDRLQDMLALVKKARREMLAVARNHGRKVTAKWVNPLCVRKGGKSCSTTK
jgi:hypothetical protein